MLSLFKKKPAQSANSTLKTRVDLFWKWYSEVAPKFYETINAGQCASLAPPVIAKVDELLPGFSWVFGPGKDSVGHSFTLSGAGVLHHQLLTQYWLSRAPILPGWTFYASRQPGSIDGKIIQIGERKFDPKEFWVTPVINAETEHIDLTVWHPLFEILPERDRWTILYLFLDEVFGEYGTEQYIGKISLNNEQLSESISLRELLGFATQVKDDAGWKKYAPGESGVIYRMKEQHDHFVRGDIVVGSTYAMSLINQYSKAEGELADPLAGTGADYVFVSFDVKILPEGKQSHARGEIEVALDEALKSDFSGRILGGAHGTKNAYIDLLLFDGKSSLGIVQRVLKEKSLPAGTEIHFFAKEKRGHRIIL